MTRKIFAISVIGVSRCPLQSLRLVKPKVSIKIGKYQRDIWESCTPETDSLHGEILSFNSSKKLVFSETVADKTMHVTVSDLDPLGSERVIATGEITSADVQPRWHPLALDTDVVRREQTRAANADLKVTTAMMINLSAQIDDADEDIEMGSIGGVEEQKEGQPRSPLSSVTSEENAVAENGEDGQFPERTLEPEEQPNTLKLTIQKAANLKNGGKDTADAYIKMSYGKKEFGKSPTVENELSPQFGWCYYIQLKDQEQPEAIEIKVCEMRAQMIGFKSEAVIGTVCITPDEVAGYMQSRVSLKKIYILEGDSKNTKEEICQGDLHLKFESIHIYEGQLEEEFLINGGYDSELDSCTSGSDCESSDEDSDDESGHDTKEDIQQAKDEAIEKASKQREEMEKMLEMMENTEVKSGRYEVKVHVIGVRGLSVRDGVPYPMVQVTAWDQKRSTSIKNQSTEATFDTILFFPLDDMVEDTLRLGHIRCEVFDANSYISKGTLIGSWQTDFDYIYYKPDHELYRKWIPLTGGEAGGNHGVTGWLQVSITILGPGDKAKHHNRTKEMEEEIRLMKDNPNHFEVDIPQTVQHLKFLVATFHKAEHLPFMDDNFVDGSGIDAYCEIQCGDLKAQKTKVVSIKTKDKSVSLSPVFKEQIWLPFYSPTMSNRVIISLWDEEKIGTERVATADILYLDMIEKFPQSYDAIWVNFYGAPLESLPPNCAGRMEEMNKSPSTASTYRGRLLMTLRVDDNKPKTIKKKGKKITSKPKKAKSFHISRAKEPIPFPQRRSYTFRMKVLIGSELPTDYLKNEFCIQMSFGPFSIRTSTQKEVNGVCFFEGETMEHSNAVFPADLSMVPDLIVYLIRNPGTTTVGIAQEAISFKRFKAKELFQQGFSGANQWIDLKEDKVLDQVRSGVHPGSILLRLGFGSDHMAENTPWESDLVEEKQTYQARIHVYQARNLPAADDTGLIDPYLKVFFGGKKVETKRKEKSKNPAFYQTLVIEDLNLPTNLKMMPMFNVQVWDWDYADDDYVGSVRVPAYHEVVNFHGQKEPALENIFDGAHWYELGREQVGDVQGEILLGFELIKIDNPNEPVPPSKPLEPDSKDYLLQLIPLGCRDLEGGWLGLQKPFVEFCINDEVIYSTEPSRNPSANQPNFLPAMKKDIHVQLPKNPVFAPALTINVKDCIFGGIQKPLIGSAYVPLESRMKYNAQGDINEHYCPGGDPSLHAFGGNPFVDLEAERSKQDIMKNRAHPNNLEASTLMRHRTQKEEEKEEIIPAIGTKGKKKKLNLGSAFELNDDEVQTMIPEYMIGREEWDESWEDRIGMDCPFERFPIYTGRTDFDGKGGLQRQCVGTFKGIIRLLSDKEQKAMKNKDPPIIQELQHQEVFQVRLYALRGRDLTPMDTMTNKSDPYLKVHLGNNSQGSRDVFHISTLSPDFYQRFDFVTKLPGVSQLHVEVWDKDYIFDELIGKTTIDLEDRWFNAQWRQTGLDPQTGKAKRPVENRTLWSHTSTNPQGFLSCWVDITMQRDARDDRPITIAPEPNTEFEMRAIVWKARNIPHGDWVEEMSDMYITCEFGALPYQQTDVHWRAIDGWGSFNYRMKFLFNLPVQEEGGTWFKIAVWDKDLLVSDDCLCEASFDLAIPLKKAFLHKETSFQLFKSEAQLQELKELQAEKRETLEIPLLEGSGSLDFPERRRRKKKSPTIWSKFKEQIGLGPDPDNSTWLPLKVVGGRDKYQNECPEVLISIEILPKTKANSIPAGFGQEDPNQNPMLPAPTGRVDFTKMLNPFYCIRSIIGMKNAHRLYCACGLVLFIIIAFALLPFMYESVGLLALIPDVKAIAGIVGALAFLVCICCIKANRDLSHFCGCRHPCDCCSKRYVSVDEDLETGVETDVV